MDVPEKTLKALEKSQWLGEQPHPQAPESGSTWEAALSNTAGAVTVLVTAVNELRNVLQEFYEAMDKASAGRHGQNRAGQEERSDQKNPVETEVPAADELAAGARQAKGDRDRNLPADRHRLQPAREEHAPADHAANERPGAQWSPAGPPPAARTANVRTMPGATNAEEERRRKERAGLPDSQTGADKNAGEASGKVEAAEKNTINRGRRAEPSDELETASQVQSGREEGAPAAAIMAATAVRMHAAVGRLLSQTHESHQETTGLLQQIAGGHLELLNVIKSLESQLREQQRQLDQVQQNLKNAGTIVGASQ